MAAIPSSSVSRMVNTLSSLASSKTRLAPSLTEIKTKSWPDLRAAWKKAEEELRSASKKASRNDRARENAIKSLTKAADREREAATKAKNELILFEGHRGVLVEERNRRKGELSVAEKRKANPGIDPVRVIDTFVAGTVKLPMKVDLPESCKPNASFTICGHPAFWGRSGNIVKNVVVDLKKKNEGSLELDLGKVKLPEGTHPLFFSNNISGKYEKIFKFRSA